MSAETAPIRAKTRRLKDLSITKAIHILENEDSVDPDLYKDTYLTVLKNSVPKAQEITGDDGAPLIIQISKPIAEKNNLDVVNTSSDTDSEGYPQI